MFEVIAEGNKIVAILPDEFVMDLYKDGYLRSAKFNTGKNGFVSLRGVQITIPGGQGMAIYIQEGYRLLPK